MSKGLTELQSRFVKEYIRDLNPEKAALRAGYAAGSARSYGEKLLENPAVVREIKLFIQSCSSRLRVEKSYIVQKLLSIAEFSLEVEEITDREGNPTGKKKLRDPSAAMKALELLSKHSVIKEDTEVETPEIRVIKNLDESRI